MNKAPDITQGELFGCATCEEKSNKEGGVYYKEKFYCLKCVQVCKGNKILPSNCNGKMIPKFLFYKDNNSRCKECCKARGKERKSVKAIKIAKESSERANIRELQLKPLKEELEKLKAQIILTESQIEIQKDELKAYKIAEFSILKIIENIENSEIIEGGKQNHE